MKAVIVEGKEKQPPIRLAKCRITCLFVAQSPTIDRRISDFGKVVDACESPTILKYDRPFVRLEVRRKDGGVEVKFEVRRKDAGVEVKLGVCIFAEKHQSAYRMPRYDVPVQALYRVNPMEIGHKRVRHHHDIGPDWFRLLSGRVTLINTFMSIDLCRPIESNQASIDLSPMDLTS
ncbi:hypothetical protein DFH28DRAFT_1118682 [Melampsora americana]|nr:hypothetical protein DFH28DRAFT_1118682 [Melampsora americana]